MAIRIFSVNEDAPFDDEEVWRNIKEDIAGPVCTDANNNTSAPIGITYRDIGTGKNRAIRIGPRGAAAIPVEFGTYKLPARRPVKRALDKRRLG